jgi:hypothetical protein
MTLLSTEFSVFHRYHFSVRYIIIIIIIIIIINAVMNKYNSAGKVMGCRLDERDFIPRGVNMERFEDVKSTFVLGCEAI